MNGYAAVARTIFAHPVDTMFGLMGDANMRHVVHYIESGGRFIGAVSEGSAVSMAHGYARTSGRPGIVSITHGPAVTNAITALTEVARAGGNVVVLTAETEADHLQAIDLRAAAEVAGATFHSIAEPATLVAELSAVLAAATTERRPTLVSIPMRVQNAELPQAGGLIDHPTGGLAEQTPLHSSDDDMDAALGILMTARRPVVLAGRGAAVDCAREDIVAIAELLAAPMGTTLQAKDLFDGHEFNLGIVGTLSHPTSIDAIVKADCLLTFGASLNKRTTVDGSLLEGKALISCDVAPLTVDSTARTHVQLRGSAGALARSLAEGLQSADYRPNGSLRTDELRSALSNHASTRGQFPRTAPGTIDMRAAADVIDKTLPIDRVLVTDSGRFTRAPWRHVRVEDPKHFVYTTSFGSIGLGVATALGAAVGCPGQVTLGVVGDGGGMMGITELSTAVRHQIPLLIVVMNDGSYGSEFSKLTSYGLDPRHSLIAWPSFAELGTALGGRGRTACDEQGLRTALLEYLEDPVPTVLDVKCDPGIDLYAGER